MADVAKFDLTKGKASAVLTTATGIVAAAPAMTIDYTGSKRVLLYVKNADAAADAYVKFTAGGGIRSSLGDLTIKVEDGKEAVIDLSDTARLLNLADKDIDVALVDAEGNALAAGVLSDITIFAINL